MTEKVSRIVALCGLVSVATTGCQTAIMDQLKAVSAGHTGCTPDQITISNHQHVGTYGTNETWNATCNGKVYLCSGVPTGKSDEEYSCAPAQ
jgi:hypothetical protein